MGGGSSKSKDPAVGALMRLIAKVQEDTEWKGTIPAFGKKPGKAAKIAKKVDILELAGCDLGPVCGATLGAALPVFQALQVLDVTKCGLGTIGTVALANALQELQQGNVKKLLLGSNFNEALKQPQCIEAICSALGTPALKGLTTIDLSDNGIGGKGAIKLSEGLIEKKPPLKELILADCQLGFTGGAAVGKAMMQLTSLRRIDLFSCNIGDHAATTIGEILASGSVPLATLGLQGNAISWEGAVELAKGLPGVAATLENLDLSSNAIGNENPAACNALGDCFRTSPPAKLRVLNLAENSLGDADSKGLLGSLGVLKALAWLDLSSNRLRPDIGEALAPALCECVELQILSLNDNDRLGDSVMVQVFGAAAKMAKLTELHASKVELTPEGATSVMALLRDCGESLAKLDLRGNVKLEAATCDELRSVGSKVSTLLLPTDEDGHATSGPLDARQMHYKYHGTKLFLK